MRHRTIKVLFDYLKSSGSLLALGGRQRLKLQMKRAITVMRGLVALQKISLNLRLMGAKMGIIKFATLFVFFACQFIATASGLTIGECSAIAAKLNKEFPQQADSITTVMSAKCDGVDPIYLTYSMRVETALTKFSSSQLQTLRQGQIDSWCSSPSQYKLLQQVGIRYAYMSSDKRYLGQTSFDINDCVSLNIKSLDSKFDSKNHPKAKGLWVTVRYPKGWQAKEGERPNMVQKFTGDYKGLFVMLSLQIMDAGAPLEKECAETSANAFGRDMVDGEDNLKILKIRKIKHEEKPAYMYDLQSSIERAGLTSNTTSRVMSVCYKNTLVSAWCSPMKIDTKKTLIQSSQNDLETIDNLCFQFFNSLVLMDKY